jgi:hypothetical protein
MRLSSYVRPRNPECGPLTPEEPHLHFLGRGHNTCLLLGGVASNEQFPEGGGAIGIPITVDDEEDPLRDAGVALKDGARVAAKCLVPVYARVRDYMDVGVTPTTSGEGRLHNRAKRILIEGVILASDRHLHRRRTLAVSGQLQPTLGLQLSDGKVVLTVDRQLADSDGS